MDTKDTDTRTDFGLEIKLQAMQQTAGDSWSNIIAFDGLALESLLQHYSDRISTKS